MSSPLLALCVFGLLRNFQLQTIDSKPPHAKELGFLLQSLKTLRFKLIHQPARLLKPQGYSAFLADLTRLIQRIDQKLKIAA